MFYSLRKLFGKRRAEQELDEEVRFHIEMSVEQKVANGMDPEAARKEALCEFGGVEQVKEAARENWGLRFLYTCWMDIRFGWRQLMKNKKHTAIIVMTLAVCMGANTTAYNLFMKLVANPYDYAEVDRIATIGRALPKVGAGEVKWISVPQYRFIEEQSESFSAIGLYDVQSYDLDLKGRIRRVVANRTTPGVWKVTGVQPLAGRFYTDADIESHMEKVVVLGESLWNELRTPENDLIGECITLDGASYEIIGVAPGSFFLGLRRANIWVPRIFKPIELKQIRNHSNEGIGKLKPGIGNLQADQELKRLYAMFAEEHPSEKEVHVRMGSTFTAVDINRNFLARTGSVSLALRIIRFVALVVLVIGCLNVAGMILVRTYGRLQEFIMRRALGASLSRLARQMFIEIALYFVLGGLGSLLLLKAGYVAAERTELNIISWAGKLNIDLDALMAALMVACAASLLTGFLPILLLLRRDLPGLIKVGEQTVGGSVGKHRTHAFFIVSQVALSVLLLVAACFLIRNLHATLQKNIGFSTENRLALEVPQPKYRFGRNLKRYLADVLPFHQRVLERLRTMPGVLSAAACNRVPISLGNMCDSDFSMRHYEFAPDEAKAYALRVIVHPGYFQTVGTRLLMGRDFEPTDTMDSDGVVIISQGIMEKYFTGLDPIGMQLTFWGRDLRIIGVAEQVRHTPFFHTFDFGCALYFPFAQWHNMHGNSSVFVVHVEGNPEVQLKNLEQAILDLDPQVTIKSTTFDEMYRKATYAQWLPMRLSIFFAAIALFLTGLGLYGLISFIVAERTREYGIRMALGARPALIVKGILKRSGRLIGWGLLVGLVLAGVMGWKINPLLADINTTAPLTYLIVAVFVLMVCLLAALLPARRATQINPMEALRAE